MLDRLAQVGLILSGFVGLSGAIKGIYEQNAAMLGCGIVGAVLAFAMILFIYLHAYKQL